MSRNAIEIKKNNRSLVLEIIHNFSPISRTEIAQISGLTRASVTNIVNEFMKAGFLEEVSSEGTGIGRKRKLLRIKEDAFYIVGVSVDRSHTRVGIFNSAANMLAMSISETPLKAGSEAVASLIMKMIEEVLKDAGISSERVYGIGVGIPGPLDFEKGVVISPPMFENWKELPLKEILEDEFRITTWVDNDANVAALGEKWFGHGKDHDNFVVLIADLGIGSGVVINKQLYRGSLKAAGEVGHMIIECDGKFVSVEDLANFSAIESGNRDRALDVLALTVVNIANIISPSLIVLGGRTSERKELLKRIDSMIDRYLFCPMKPDVRVTKLGRNVTLFGAAALALEELIKSPYGILLK